VDSLPARRVVSPLVVDLPSIVVELSNGVDTLLNGLVSTKGMVPLASDVEMLASGVVIDELSTLNNVDSLLHGVVSVESFTDVELPPDVDSLPTGVLTIVCNPPPPPVVEPPLPPVVEPPLPPVVEPPFPSVVPPLPLVVDPPPPLVVPPVPLVDDPSVEDVDVDVPSTVVGRGVVVDGKTTENVYFYIFSISFI